MMGKRGRIFAQAATESGLTWRARLGPHVPLLALILVAWAMLLWRVDAKCLWWDESLSLYRAQGSLPRILSNRIDFAGLVTTDQHPPLYFLLLHGLTRLSGESDLVLRFPSVAWAILIVPLLYGLGRRLRSPRVGLLAALLGALSPFYLWYAQEARMYTMVTALGLASVYFLWRACAEHEWKWGLAFGLSMIAAILTQYLSLLLLIPQALLALILWPRARHQSIAVPLRRSWRLAGLAILFVPLVALAFFRHQFDTLMATLRSGREYVPLLTILSDMLNSFSLGLSVSLARVWMIDLVFLAGLIIGVVSLWLRPPQWGYRIIGRYRRLAGLSVLLGPLLVLPLSLWLFSLWLPIYTNSRYLTMASPFFYLGIALGLDAVMQHKRVCGWGLALVLVAGMVLSNYRYFYDEQYQTKEDYRSVAQNIQVNERVGDVIVVNGSESMPAFRHYYRGDLPIVALPTVGSTAGQIDRQLDGLAQRYERIWFLRARTAVTDPDQQVAERIGQRHLLLGRRGFESHGFFLSLSTFQANSPIKGPAPASRQPLGTFDGRLSLLGCAVRYRDTSGSVQVLDPHRPQGSPATEALPAGTTLSVNLDWRPDRPLVAYKTSLRLVSAEQLWLQRDQTPFVNLSTTEWPVGALIQDTADLYIPPGTPPMTYRLQLWVYEEKTGQALSFRYADGWEQPYIDLGDITVIRERWPFTAKEFLGQVEPYRPAIVFGGTLRLLACPLTPESVQPGGEVSVQPFWHSLRAPRADYELVFNWTDASGVVWHTEAVEITGSGYDTSRWGAGAMIRGQLKLRVPEDAPTGQHHLHLLVRARGSDRLLWLRRGVMLWSGHDLELGTITVAQ